jgi:PPOX class probable F420-dependent enzyme
LVAGFAYEDSHHPHAVARHTTSAASVDQPRAIAVLAGKYLSLTTFRRDGTGVATPVWFVQEGRRLLVETDRYSYKVHRIRGNPDVQIAVCTATGRLRGQQMNARAELLPDAETGRVERLLADKYRRDLVFIRPIRALQTMLHRGERRANPVIVAITPN